MMRIVEGDLDDPRVVALLAIHVETARAETARGSAHALDLDALRAPDIGVWTIWEDNEVLAVGAIKRLTADHGEIKSMHTAERARGRGVGTAMLRHLIYTARADGLAKLSLETGSWDYFRPARALYGSAGFTECAPFGAYRLDPNSIFLSCDIGDVSGGAASAGPDDDSARGRAAEGSK